MPRKIMPALALSTVVLAPAAHAFDFDIDDRTTVSVYGTIEPELLTQKDADGDFEGDLKDNDSTLGVRVENQFTSGVTGFAQAEFEHDETESDSGLNDTDSAFLGLKGDFGTFRIGNFDNVYEDSIIDATEVAEEAEISDEATATEESQAAYYSPMFHGFSIQTQVRYLGASDGDNPTGDEGVGAEIVASYRANNWRWNIGYDYRGGTLYDSDDDGKADDFADKSTLGTSVVATFDPFEVGAKLALQDNVDNDPDGDDTAFAALRGTYHYGAGKIYASVQQVEPDAGQSRTEFTAGVKHTLYDNLQLWAEAGAFDRHRGEGDVISTGAIYSF